MKLLLLLLSLSLGGCTCVTITKPDGTRIQTVTLFQDAQVGKVTFSKSTTQPSESFTMEGFDQKARLETINKALDLLGMVK